VSHTDPLAEFESLAEALEATFARALNLAGSNDLAPLVDGAENLLVRLRWQPHLIQAEIVAIGQRLQQAPLWEHQDTSGRTRAVLDDRLKACEAALRRAEQLIPRHEANLRSLEARLEEEQRRKRPPRRIVAMRAARAIPPATTPPEPQVGERRKRTQRP
jgi:hypothetical protein